MSICRTDATGLGGYQQLGIIGASIMRIVMPAALALGVAFGANAASATAMKATAPEKMMPSDQAKKMRVCEKSAIQQQIKMEDRSRFVSNCMAAKT